ncbi:NAD-dependent epimerase/dehydratase family protein [Kitasatospora sp. NPDC002227]|uniref:NAD-dependent epimerase/dehydratase family protein n=1 Tax=Kitasatospora sp. NPDC002227 TaxID=3154773 RepID=UPI00332093B4
MLVLVTGAYGFVGRAVVRRLAADGHQVRALTHRPPTAALPSLPVERTHHADVRDRAALAPAVAGVDAVCHLAALTNGRDSGGQAERYREVNLGGTTALLDALAAEGLVRRFVLGSTAAVYGAPERQPITETTGPAPGNPYGASKLAAERELDARTAAGQVEGVVLRCFNVGGTEDRDQARIIPRALAVAAGHHPALELNGDGSVVRDFVHVEDLARAYALALTAPLPPAPGARVYNVGATPASMREIIATVEQVTGRRVPLNHRPPVAEAPYLAADTSRITRELGWKPERSDLVGLVTDAWQGF